MSPAPTPSVNIAGGFDTAGRPPLMAMVEVTPRCNLSCPVCFADAHSAGEDPPLDEIRRRLERLLRVCGGPIPLQISGGEPTLREDLADVIRLAANLGFQHIELITNGIRISREPDLLKRYREHGLNAVYLQFDGLAPETHQAIRGRDLTAVRRGALKAIREAGMCCTLVVTVVRGINDDRLGEVVDLATDHLDIVKAVSFQAARRFKGRFAVASEKDGYSLEELTQTIAEQAGIRADGFRSVGVGHPCCNALAYLYPDRNGAKSLFDYLSDADIRVFLGENARGKILDMFRGKRFFVWRHVFRLRSLWIIRRLSPIFGANPLNLIRKPHLLLFAKSFMEADQMDPERIDRCCYGVAAPQGVMSFCAFNNQWRHCKQE